ncbi:MAG: trypsin-like peptidase domain-containing protein [Acidimicrobiaceae bacterium]|nr:trypsin-like peptidase domain-containing protein [Acidimicrobiaceae bacterium]
MPGSPRAPEDVPTKAVPALGVRPKRRGDGSAAPVDGAATPSAPAPARIPLRRRVLPRTVLGTTALILSFAIGAGLSGVVLYSYYQYRLDQTNQRVNLLVNGYQKKFDNAEADLNATVNQAESQIQSRLAPIENLEGDPQALAALTRKLAPSMFFVHTLDAGGAASVGSAFVVTSNAKQSLLLTSYTTIAAATRSPAPAVYIRQGSKDSQVSVRTWDPANDLALIVLPIGSLPALKAAPSSPAPKVGEKVYAISGLGSAGVSISEGAISDVSGSALANTAPIGPQFQGGPIVNSDGQVLAVASRTFSPFGFAAKTVSYAPYLQAACSKVLTCPGGQFPT